MSYSRRQLYAMGEPLGDGATRRAVGGKIIYGGGGDSTPEKQTTVVDIPDWAKPYAKESLGKASALTSTPYQTYGGERIAQFSPLQKQAFQQAGQQQVAGQVGLGSGLATLSGISSFQDPGTAQGFMSPYMQAVVDQQMESAQRQADIAATQRGAQAVRAGAFGGSRQAIENAEAARALASQKGQIQAQGLQSAFERAQQQFNAEQANRLSAAQTLGQLGQQQFGQQMDITGQQAQFGQQQRQATQDILSAQYQDFLNQQRAPYDQLAFMSSIIRGTPMGQTTTMYSPPPSATSQLIGLGTAAAGAYGAYAGKAAGGEVKGYAAGGIASLSQPEIAAAADSMSDQQLQQTQGLPSITDLARMTLAAEAQQRAQMRQAATAQQAMMAQQPQMTVAEEQLAAIDAMDQGLGGLEVPDDMIADEGMAGGGIVAFANGGTPNFYQRAYAQGEEKGSIYDPYFGLPAAERERRRAEDEANAMARRGQVYENFPGEAEQLALIGQPGNGIGVAQQEIDDLVANRQELVRRFGQKMYDQKLQKLSQNLLSAEETVKQRQQAEAQAKQQAAKALEQARAKATPAASGIASLATLPAETPRGRGVGFTDPRLTQSGINQSVAALQAAETQANATGKTDGGGKKQPGPPGVGGLGGIMGMMDREQARQIAAQAEIDKLRAADVATARGELAEEEKRAAEFGSEREKRLKAQEEKLAGSEKQNFNMTLIEAGLAMMAGESPNALQNLAAGAAQGLKGYQGRLQTLQNSREKLDESMARLAEIREEKMSAVGARKRELNQQERSILTESKAAQEKIASAFAGEKIKFTKEQADKASDRAFDVWKIQQRGDQDSLALQRMNLSALNSRRILLQGQLAQAIKDADDAEVSRLRSLLADIDNSLASKSGASGAPASGGKVLNFADI